MTIVLVQNKVCSFSWRCVIQCKSWFIFGIAARLLIVIIHLLRIFLLGYYKKLPWAQSASDGVCFVLTNVQMNCEIIFPMYLSLMKVYTL